jgi:hypothetical protein
MPEQTHFDSLMFPPDRRVLMPAEIAARLKCDVRHVYDLITEGKLQAVNISGANNLTDRRCLRVPVEAWKTFVKEATI